MTGAGARLTVGRVRWSGHIRDQVGQTHPEYLGLLLLVALVVAAATGPVSAIPERISDLVCEISGGGDCEAQAEEQESDQSDASEESEEPEEPEETPEQREARELGESEFGESPPGTPDERARTTTPPPPGGDQCSMSPDVAGTGDWILYDFSYACYGHDVCWQNGTLDGERQTIGSCNQIFEDLMREHCDLRWTGFGSGAPENACFAAASAYREAVDIAGLAKAREDCPWLFYAGVLLSPDYVLHHCRP
jgi:hypothetical protein